jgi:DNA-binding response OmpR family regulator
MKILVVEDDPLILTSLREMVEAWVYACDEASDGRVAWELLQACPYDLVLLDLNLPGIDGLTLCQRLRQAGGATCSKESLLQACWNWSDSPGVESLKTHVKNLRAKLGAAGAPTDLVETVYGVGFRLHPARAA